MSAVATRAAGRNDPVDRLAQEYTDSAAAYARLWGPTLLPLIRPLLETLPLEGARRVVDVGTGAGDLLPRLRARAPRAEVLGVDRSPGMLEQARFRGRGPVTLMDARSLALPGASTDVLTLPFVLFHLPRPVEALREARRVLRSGGTLGLVTWSASNPSLPGEALWQEELDRAGAGPDPRPKCVRRYGATDGPAKVTRLLQEAGFSWTRSSTRRYERRWEPGELARVRRWFGPSGRRLSTLSGARQRKTWARLRERMTALPAEELVWRPEVVFAMAGAPEYGGVP